jgi:pimeloyl-ACP methyl ester carboxylesterase
MIIKRVLIALLALGLLAVVAVGGYFLYDRWSTDRRQSQLASFYETPSPFPSGNAGDLIRTEPLTGTFTLPGGSAHRILYLSEDSAGEPRIASGMVFIPDTPAPPEGRKVVSWAHPTTGMGDACAPSRAAKPLGIMTWLPAMMKQGWAVAATDYAGLGTEGIQEYLIAQAEVHDVVNAVRALQQFPESGAGNDYAIYGHSQGGHAALWAGTLAPDYAPELNLVGVAGAAPAAPLNELVEELWPTAIAWVIGAEVMVSFPEAYPGLDPAAVVTNAGLGAYQNLADQCLLTGIAEAELRTDLFDEQFFTKNPMDDPAWAEAINAQSAPPPPADMPVLTIESVNDGVVAPPAIADMADQWCAAGANLTVDWLGPLRGQPETLNVQTHMYEGSAGGASATTWFEQLFAGEQATSNCGVTAPLALSGSTEVDTSQDD